MKDDLNNLQVTCGSELALLFVETLVKGKVSYYEETLGKSGLMFLNSGKFSRPIHL